jgi:hypothetical protein
LHTLDLLPLDPAEMPPAANTLTLTAPGHNRKRVMSFLFRVLRFLFWLLVLSWAARLLQNLVARMMRRAAPPMPPNGVDVAARSEAVGLARRLVRDPFCGVHVAQVLAIPLRDGGETLHFCSVNCRDEYARRRSLQQERLAANG